MGCRCRGEGCCGVGGPSRDSSGFGAIEEGLISRGDRTSGFLSISYSHSSVPAELGQESQASSCVEELNPTLCDPIDGSPQGSPAPGILQARTLEWVAISFSSA